MQEIIVYLIIATAVAFLIHHLYRHLKGKQQGCNCSSCQHGCPHTGDSQCHCH